MNARQMQAVVYVLELRYDAEADAYTWQPLRRTWAMPQLSEKTNVFSRVGVGARDAQLTMRRQSGIAPGTLLRWQRECGAQMLFVSAVTPQDRNYITVHAACVQLRGCLAEANHTPPGARFEGILTEKYVGHDTVDPMAMNVTTYVLVCPKAVTLKRGAIVEVDGAGYHVLLGHMLDEYKNEYEIQRVEDL